MQTALFDWASSQTGATGLVIFLAGMLYAFAGARMFVPLLSASNALLVFVLGQSLARAWGIPPLVAAGFPAAVALFASAKWPSAGLTIGAGVTWGLLARYLLERIGLGGVGSAVIVTLAGLIGSAMALLCTRTMRVIHMTLHGAVLIMLGFVALSSAVFPTLGTTFLWLAADWSFMIPILLAMVFTTAYSYQSMILRGDIRTGAM
jgi:hypothetical protein